MPVRQLAWNFVKDVGNAPGKDGVNGRSLVDNQLMKSADYFWHVGATLRA